MNIKKDADNGEFDLELLGNFKKNNEPKTKKRKKVFAIIKKVLYVTCITVLGVLIVFSFCDKMGWIKFGSKKVIAVATGSMSQKNEINTYLDANNLNNQFPAGSLIVIERVDKEDLQLFDVIAYTNDKGVTIIHRIVNIDNTGEQTKYLTRGDANNVEDSFKPTFDNIQGKYTNIHVPALGAIIIFLQSAWGIATIIALIVAFVLLDGGKNKIYQIRIQRLGLLLENLALNETNIIQLTDDELIEKYKSLDLTKLNDIENQLSDNEQSTPDTTDDGGDSE